MPKVGISNPLPFEIGGGPSTTEKYYSSLKSSVGIGGSANDGTIEAQWRMSRARGLRAAYSDDRAINQFFPDRCTDFIPVWEEILKMNSGVGICDQDRRDLITEKVVFNLTAVTSVLEDELQEIDPLFSILNLSFDYSRSTILGRGFEDSNTSDPDACGPAFNGGRKSTQWPNYSDEYVCYVFYDIGSTSPTAEQDRRVARAQSLLAEVLPSWIDFKIVYDNSDGFVLDEDLLGIGTF